MKENHFYEKHIKNPDFLHRPVFVEKVIKQDKKRDFCCCGGGGCCCCCCRRATSLQDLDLKSLSGCDLFDERRSDSWNTFNCSSQPRRKCKSNPNFSKPGSKKFDNERELQKIKRSLKLLGLELSDFGINPKWGESSPPKKPDEKTSTFSTKITHRSVSLDSLKAAVKRALEHESFDESHRKLLSQAAYEEWYFKKEKELWVRRNEERLTRLKAQEAHRDNYQRKKEKSEEEFRKWLEKKAAKRKRSERAFNENQKNSFNKLKKTKEESEQAFIKWKKNKEEELEKKKKERKKEEEKRLQSEREKNEKRIIAEKAFQQWKTKLEETETAKEAERRKKEEKNRQEIQERRKQEQESKISFEMWKALKDEQIKEQMKKFREAYKLAVEERMSQMEERMYEAEQAFEDWLEKVESRRQKQFSGVNSYSKTVPWIPA